MAPCDADVRPSDGGVPADSRAIAAGPRAEAPGPDWLLPVSPGPVAAALLLLVAAVFGHALGFDLVWDDKDLIRDNPWLRQPATLWLAWQSDFWHLSASANDSGMYRPLVTLAYWLEFRLFGDVAAGYHAATLVLHTANALLVWRLARQLGIAPGAALAGAALFAVHPVQVEAAANVASHTDLLATLAVLVATTSLCGARPRPLVAACALALAPFAKETALVAPVLALGAAWLAGRRSQRDAALLLCGLPYLVLRSQALDAAAGPAALIAFPSAAAVGAGLAESATRLLRYASRVIAPVPQAPIHPLPAPEAWLVVVAALAVLAMLLWWARGARSRGESRGGVDASASTRARFVAAGFVLPLVPVLELLPLGARFADLLLYLPMVPVALGAGWAVEALARHRSRAGVALPAVASVLLVAALTSSARAGVWASDLSLWSHAVALRPDVPTSVLNLGNALRAAGHPVEGCARLGEALGLLEHAGAASAGRRAVVHFNLGNCARDAARVAAAEAHYRRAAELSGGRLLAARRNRIVLLMETGRDEAAVESARALARDAPDVARSWHLLGVALARLGRLAPAEQAFARAVALAPRDGESAAMLARVRADREAALAARSVR